MRIKKRNRKYLILLLIPLVAGLLAFRHALFPVQGKPVVDKDSLTSPTYVQTLIRYQRYYPFIRYDRNYIEWSDFSAIQSFFTKISQTPNRKLKILHIGDSHLQSDFPTGYIRERMQELFGDGGRGLVFPYKAAGTHPAYDYRTFCNGNWDYTRNVQREAVLDMGVIGATIRTSDSSAGFKIVFRDGFIRPGFTVIKLFCKQDSLSYDVRLKTGGSSSPILLSCNNYASKKAYIEIKLSKPSDTLEFVVNKTEKKQNFFECYGIQVESNEDKGVLYNSIGINGAGYKSILKQRLFGKQLPSVDPDLVVIDLGANDFYAGGFNAVDLEKDLSAIIDTIKRACPEACIIVSNAQDIFYKRRRSIPQCKDFMEMTKRVAMSKKCAFYDYYDVAGGSNSMTLWFKAGLGRNDKVHLSAPGYYVRGELLLNAMLNSYRLSLARFRNDSLDAQKYIIDTTSLKKYFVDEINIKQEKNEKEPKAVYNEPEQETEAGDKIYYTIRSGDNLGSIAEKYGTTVSNIQYWNGLRGTKIVAGETIIIYKKGAGVDKLQNKTTVEQKQYVKPKQDAIVPNTAQSSRKGNYKVTSGDSLWSIAKKYGTTVEAIKKANKLSSDKLSIGQTLIIP
jgi:LysM repeat protein/lysophospholipase L1-like esterase